MKKKNNSSEEQYNFAAIFGKLFEGDSEEHEAIGTYVKIVGVKKVRRKEKKNKVILNLGEVIEQFHTEEDISKGLPPSKGKNNAFKIQEGEDKDDQLKMKMREWISHLIIEEDYHFIGMIKGASDTLPLSDLPETLRLDTGE